MFHTSYKKTIQFTIMTLALTILASCTMNIEEKQGPLGQEASPEQMQKAFDELAPESSILNAREGQYVLYENNIRFEQGATYKLQDIKHTLLDIKDNIDEPEIKFILFADKWVYDLASGQITDEKHSELEPLYYTKQSVGPHQSKLFKLNADETDDPKENICDGQDVDDGDFVYDCVRYFNLTTRELYVDPPFLVTRKSNCMNLPNCKMRVRYISYDEVLWRQGQIVNRISVRAEVAPDVPDIMYTINDNNQLIHTLPVLSFCSSGLTNIDNKKYYISQCQVLRDYE